MFGRNDSLVSGLSSVAFFEEVNEYLATREIVKKIKFNPDYLDDVRAFFSVSKGKRKTILCSFRKQVETESDIMSKYIAEQKSQGNFCYYPSIHNFQKDDYKGLVICNTM